jgi:hypothetical protein
MPGAGEMVYRRTQGPSIPTGGGHSGEHTDGEQTTTDDVR